MTLEAGPDSPLAALGFDPAAQRVYGVVLRNPGSRSEDVGWMSGLEGDVVEAILDGLQGAGLVRRDGALVQPLPPEDAIGRLLVTRAAELRSVRDELEEARRRLPHYVALHHASAATTGEVVTLEVIRGRDLVGLMPGLAASAPGEMLFLRPDQWRYDDGRRADDVVIQLIREGRSSRVLYPARALEEAPAAVRTRADQGEQVRFLTSLPTRLAIFGTGVALLPVRLGSDAERVLVIRQESLVAALRLYFEGLWERGLSLPGLDPAAEGGPDRRLFLEQLASGAKDEQIARALGMSLRTVRRRIADIMTALGAESRFQAGTEAVRRGWL